MHASDNFGLHNAVRTIDPAEKTAMIIFKIAFLKFEEEKNGISI